MGVIKVAPPEVLTVLKQIKHTHDRRRFRHLNCSEGKSAAGMVSKRENGGFWYCFRCEDYGHIQFNRSPKELADHLHMVKECPTYKELEEVELPSDIIYLVDEKDKYSVDPDIPTEAFHWLWNCDLSKDVIKKYGFGWSPMYKRVIIPIFHTILTDSEGGTDFIGWIGREVTHTKEKLKELKIPRYVTRKRRDVDRIYFSIDNYRREYTPDNMRVVIVEDVLSAIKIHMATGIKVIALLNASLNRKLMDRLKSMTIILWLDSDKYGEMVACLTKYNQLGFRMAMRLTQQDPKYLNSQEINDKLGY